VLLLLQHIATMSTCS